MMKEVIISNAKTKAITTELVKDNAREWVDYQGEIDACKQRLAETDYVVIKIAEGAATKDEYTEIIAERQVTRERIRELEGLAKMQAESEIE